MVKIGKKVSFNKELMVKSANNKLSIGRISTVESSFISNNKSTNTKVHFDEDVTVQHVENWKHYNYISKETRKLWRKN